MERGMRMRGKVTAAKNHPLPNREGRQEMKMPTDIDLVPRVRAILEDSATQRKTITFGEIERRVGEKIAAWNKVLDPIYDDCMAQGHPDLTAIVIYKETGYPPFFSDGGGARSKRFNPNNLRQVERWQQEVSRVFEWCKKEK
jgi:hypothetical protein